MPNITQIEIIYTQSRTLLNLIKWTKYSNMQYANTLFTGTPLLLVAVVLSVKTLTQAAKDNVVPAKVAKKPCSNSGFDTTSWHFTYPQAKCAKSTLFLSYVLRVVIFASQGC